MARTADKTCSVIIVGLCLVSALALTACGGSGDAEEPASQDGAAATATSSSPPASPERLAAAGERLEPLSGPPERSVWALSADAYDEGVELVIEFEPYGYGPSSFGPSIVALVSSAAPQDSDARIPKLSGRNVVLIVGDTEVEAGGSYTGKAITRLQDDRIVIVLQEASPKDAP